MIDHALERFQPGHEQMLAALHLDEGRKIEQERCLAPRTTICEPSPRKPLIDLRIRALVGKLLIAWPRSIGPWLKKDKPTMNVLVLWLSCVRYR
jgi:hypothetical protein